uniref:Uncharacterized protein n=1 Tax=Setaria digitata TaxID=48799 RepID=A0A915PBT0_9BILA
MSSFDPPMLITFIFVKFLLTFVISDTSSFHSSKSAILKNDFAYYPPAEPDYPPITAYAPSAKLPASSALLFEDDDLKKPMNPDRNKIYGNRLMVQVSSVQHPDNFKENKDEPEWTSISDLARHYLRGANFEKIKAPTCRLISCHGPYPNDGSLLINKENGTSDEECEQVFVQMNGCVADKGYPIGMKQAG